MHDVVPTAGDHDEFGADPSCVVWQYLKSDTRLRRRVETIEIRNLRRGHRTIAIDFDLPRADEHDEREWLIPLAFLDKHPVAPDLEVTDASGAAISVPTKDECMGLTEAALDELDDAKSIDLGAAPELRDLAFRVVRDDLIEAWVMRDFVDLLAVDDDGLLRQLMFMCADGYLLWVPVTGAPGTSHQITISRRQPLWRDLIIRRSAVLETREIDTPIGRVEVTFDAYEGRLGFDFAVALRRLRQMLGLTSIQYHHQLDEAYRFSSCHLRVLAPQGLVVRDLGLEAPSPGPESESDPELYPVNVDASQLSVRGYRDELAHLHCPRPDNPRMLLLITVLGLRDRLIGLWAAVAVVTAGLLLAVLGRAPYPIDSGDGSLEVTAAVLLIGPTLASTWALRADHGEVLETMTAGARWLLLASAAFSVATAFGLAGFPSMPDDYESMARIYASAAFVIAVLLSIAALANIGAAWLAYRTVLLTARRNALAIVLLALVAGLVVLHLDGVWVGVMLALLGLGMAAVATSSGPASSKDARGAYPVIAWIGAAATVFAAGHYLGFYGHLLSTDTLETAAWIFEFALAMSALLLAWRVSGRRRPALITV